MFNADITILEPDGAIKYQLKRDDAALSYKEVLTLWQSSSEFRAFFNGLLQSSAFEAFFWETPSLSTATVSMPFEFVLLDAQSLASRAPDAVTYSDYFTDDDNYKNNDEGIVVFDNLGGDATLVAPSPRAGHEAYGHLATFVRNAPVKQIDSFWRVTGKTVESCVSDVPIWLSTAGGGVAWLHIRIDSYPKYYGHSEYRNR